MTKTKAKRAKKATKGRGATAGRWAARMAARLGLGASRGLWAWRELPHDADLSSQRAQLAHRGTGGGNGHIAMGRTRARDKTSSLLGSRVPMVWSPPESSPRIGVAATEIDA